MPRSCGSALRIAKSFDLGKSGLLAHLWPLPRSDILLANPKSPYCHCEERLATWQSTIRNDDIVRPRLDYATQRVPFWFVPDGLLAMTIYFILKLKQSPSPKPPKGIVGREKTTKNLFLFLRHFSHNPSNMSSCICWKCCP